jgi:hypothetical protein
MQPRVVSLFLGFCGKLGGYLQVFLFPKEGICMVIMQPLKNSLGFGVSVP